MINLLPPQGKKRVTREYIVRVCTVAGILFSFSLVASAAALVPTYVLFMGTGARLEREEKKFSQDEEEYAHISEVLKTATEVAQQLQKPVVTIEAAEIVSHLETALFADIVLDGVQLSQNKAEVQIQARGTARTRESLQHFLNTLKHDQFFSDAQIPVADLAKDTNALFTITLVRRPS